MARNKDFDENEVLARAIQIFWHQGYNGTSMQDLVDGLGISRSSLYDTYTDKHTLFIKALESYQQAGAAKIQQIINQESVSSKEIIRQLLELTTGELIVDQQQKGCFMVNAGVEVAPHDQQVSKMVCQNDQQMEEAFYQVIKNGQDKGEFNAQQDVRALSRFILNAVKGMRVTAKSTADKTIFADIIRLTISALN